MLRIIDFFRIPEEMYLTDEEGRFIDEHFNDVAIWRNNSGR